MELIVTTVGANKLNAVLSGYGFLIATVGSRQWLLQPVARKVASRRGRVGEGRRATARQLIDTSSWTQISRG